MNKNYVPIIFFLLLIISGCMGGNNDHKSHSEYIASGSTAGAYYEYAEKLSDTINKMDNSKEKYSPLVTSGSKDNLELLTNKNVTFAILQSDIITPEIAKKNNIRLVSPIISEGIYFFSLSKKKPSEPVSIRDVKKIWIGAEGSGQRITAERLVKLLFPERKIDKSEDSSKIAGDGLRIAGDGLRIAGDGLRIAGDGLRNDINSIISNAEKASSSGVEAIILVLSKEHSIAKDIADGVLDGFAGKKKINDSRYQNLLPQGTRFFVNTPEIEDKTLDAISSVYPIYKLDRSYPLIFTQNALLTTLKSTPDEKVKTILLGIDHLNKQKNHSTQNDYMYMPLPVHSAAVDNIESLKEISERRNDLTSYLYFSLYMVSFVTAAFLLIWLAVFNKTSFFKKGIRSDAYGILSWIISHKIFTYTLVFLLTLYIASFSIQKIEENIVARLNIESEFPNNISDIIIWLIFVISTGLDHGAQPLNSLSNFILIIQQLLVVIGLPTSILATSWDMIEQFFTGRIGIATNKLANHIVFVGWKDSFAGLINNILALRPNQKIAIIGEISNNPIINHTLPLSSVGFMNKLPSSEKALSLVSIDKCSAAVVNLDDNIVDIGVPFIIERLTSKKQSKLYLISTHADLSFDSKRVSVFSKESGFKEFILNIQIKFSKPLAIFLQRSINSALSHDKYAHSLLNERYITPDNSWKTSKAMNISKIRNNYGYTSLQSIFIINNPKNLTEHIINFSDDLIKVNIKLLGIVINYIINGQLKSLKIYSPFERDLGLFEISEPLVNFEISSLSIFFVLRES